MPTYITLLRFTQKGIESIKDGPKRLDAAKQAFRAAGAEMKAFYLVNGRYDAVAITEAPKHRAGERPLSGERPTRPMVSRCTR